MAVGLRITKEMLENKANLLQLEDIDTFIIDLDLAIEELTLAFKGHTDIPFDLKNVNYIIKHAFNNNLGLGEAITKITEQYKFPFREQTILTHKRILINGMNGAYERLSKAEIFDQSRLMTVLYEDEKKVNQLDEYYDLDGQT